MKKLGIVPNIIPEDPDEQIANGFEYIHQGHVLEVPTAREYAQRTGCKIIGRQVEYFHEDWLRCHIDFLAKDKDRETFIIEIKCVKEFAFKNHWVGGIPADVQVQVQIQLALSGLNKAVVVACVGGSKLEIYELLADKKMQDEYISKATIVWQQLQMAKNDLENWEKYIPDFVKEAKALETAKQINNLHLHESYEYETVRLNDEETIDTILRIEDAKDVLKTTAGLKEQLETKMRKRLGEKVGKVIVPGIGEFSLKKGKRGDKWYTSLYTKKYAGDEGE